MTTDYEFLRELIKEIPEVKRLLIEREQIKQDARAKSRYTKPAPHLTPSNDKYHPKKHTHDKSKDKNVKKAMRKKLTNNAQKIEKTIHKTLKERDDLQSSKNLKEMNGKELVVFIKKGRDTVLKNRKQRIERKKQVISESQMNKAQERFDKTNEAYKQEKSVNKLDNLIASMKREIQKPENEKEIDQDQGFSY